MKKLRILFLCVFTAISITSYAVIQEGSCGYNVNFVIEDDGTLIIKGSGHMYDYLWLNTPWRENVTKVSKIIITDDVSYIGNYAFAECVNAISVSIPESITTIGESAFSRCSSLTSVEIPNSVTTIKKYAFNGCSKLSSVIIPNSISCIGDNTFMDCVSLNNVIIPNSVTKIGNHTFYGCAGLDTIIIPNSVTYIGIATFAGCTGLKTITIPNSVTNIGNNTFAGCTGLVDITIPNSVTTIGDYTFEDCEGITSFTIPSSVNNIGNGTFARCTGLVDITIPNSVTTIGDNVFNGCKGFTSFTIPNSIKSIGAGCFMGCSGLISISIPETLNTIGESAFYGCDGLNAIDIPRSVTSIGENAFAKCSGLKDLKVSKDNNYYKSVDNVLFDKEITSLIYCVNTKVGEYHVPNTVNKINTNAFAECKSLNNIHIPNSVTTIERGAFENCSNITSIILPNSLDNIGIAAFRDCSKLTSINIPNSISCINDWMFCGCYNLASIIIPNTIVSIGEYAFSNCKSLEYISIPNSVKEIREAAFDYCSSITSIEWNSKLSYTFYYSTRINEIHFGDDITTIYPISSYNYKLNKVILGKNVEYIRQEVFKDATNLKEFYITGEKDIYLYPNVFQNASLNNATLYVPKSRVEYYKTTAPWNEFGKILTLDGEKTETSIIINDECTEFTHSNEKCKEISYTRNFTNTNWQALYVPFTMNYDVWKDDFEVAYINDVRQYDDDEDGTADRTEVEVFKMKEGKSIEPNTPYLIKAKTTGEKTITLEDATLYHTQENTYDVTSWFTRFNFIGTYHTVSNMASNGYYAMFNGELKKATSDAVTLQPFRWYLSVTDRNGNPVSLNSKSMSIVFDDGETTGIETINNEAKESSSIHTLTGISKGSNMKALAPGIYIKNGKKFIVK